MIVVEIQTGERIFGELIEEAHSEELLSEGEARALNEDLQTIVTRLEAAYDREARVGGGGPNSADAGTDA